MRENLPIKHDPWRSFPHTFAERMSANRWKPFPYLKKISLAIALAVNRGTGLILVSLPPRHGKSEFISVWTPTWFLNQFPTKNVILASYAAEFASSWGRRVRNEIMNNPASTIKLSQDSKAADRWNTNQGGGMVTAGIGGQIIGKGGQLLVIDDPVKNWSESMSTVYQEKTVNWFKSTFWTRREPGAVVILLMQRWTQNDLYGWVLANSKELGVDVTELCFPALAEEKDPLGRGLNEALCPERYNAHALNSIRTMLGSHMFSALYQQRPTPNEGGIIKRKWLKFYKELPARLEETIQSWDLAVTGNENSSFCAGQVWAKKQGEIFLIDRIKARADFPAQIEMIMAMTAKHPRAFTKIVEAKATGPAVMATLEKKVMGLIGYDPDKSKELRLQSVSPMFEAGNVYLPDPSIAPWVMDYIEELVSFPNAPNDDEVDCTSQALLRFQSQSSTLEELLRF